MVVGVVAAGPLPRMFSLPWAASHALVSSPGCWLPALLVQPPPSGTYGMPRQGRPVAGMWPP